MYASINVHIIVRNACVAHWIVCVAVWLVERLVGEDIAHYTMYHTYTHHYKMTTTITTNKCVYFIIMLTVIQTYLHTEHCILNKHTHVEQHMHYNTKKHCVAQLCVGCISDCSSSYNGANAAGAV